jgi:hypothetical protein
MFIDPTMIIDNVLAGYWDAADAVGNSPYVADPEGLWERKRDVLMADGGHQPRTRPRARCDRSAKPARPPSR